MVLSCWQTDRQNHRRAILTRPSDWVKKTLNRPESVKAVRSMGEEGLLYRVILLLHKLKCYISLYIVRCNTFICGVIKSHNLILHCISIGYSLWPGDLAFKQSIYNIQSCYGNSQHFPSLLSVWARISSISLHFAQNDFSEWRCLRSLKFGAAVVRRTRTHFGRRSRRLK